MKGINKHGEDVQLQEGEYIGPLALGGAISLIGHVAVFGWVNLTFWFPVVAVVIAAGLIMMITHNRGKS